MITGAGADERFWTRTRHHAIVRSADHRSITAMTGRLGLQSRAFALSAARIELTRYVTLLQETGGPPPADPPGYRVPGDLGEEGTWRDRR
jgi:hypothetical protein